MAAEEGFEPSQTESESVVLPLHNSPKSTTRLLYHLFQKSQAFCKIFLFVLILRIHLQYNYYKTPTISIKMTQKIPFPLVITKKFVIIYL